MSRTARAVPWLDLRGDVYYAFWYDPESRETKRCSLRTHDAGEARDRFAAFLTEGTFAKPRGSPGLTVARALDDYYEEHVRPHVADKVRQRNAILHLKAFFRDTNIVDVDIPRSRRYADMRRNGLIEYPEKIGGRHGDGKADDSTIRRELGVLVAAANHAKRWKRLLAGIDVEKPYAPLLGQDDEAPHYSREEIGQLIGQSCGELRWFIELAYYTGARRASIERLERSQVRLEQKRIHLQKPGKRTTKKRQPIVPIFAEMEPAVRALLEHGGATRLFTTNDFYGRFNTLCKSLGMPDRAHPHLLRHSRATHLLQAGKPLYAVAGLLGDTVATVARVYGHNSVDHIHRDLGEELMGG